MSGKPKIIFVLGAPGSGKGTQCSMIVKEFGFVHISAGDLLREEMNTPGSKFGELIQKYIKTGGIVPVEITCGLLEKAMRKYIKAARTINGQTERGDEIEISESEELGEGKFLIDGFPRNQNNLDGWNKLLADKVNTKFMLFLECEPTICFERCLKRGAAGSGRTDDNEESLKKRFNTYTSETMPVVEHFNKLNLLRKIDASGSPDDVFNRIKVLFDEI